MAWRPSGIFPKAKKAWPEGGVDLCGVGGLVRRGLSAKGFGKAMLVEKSDGRGRVGLCGEERNVEGASINEDDVSDLVIWLAIEEGLIWAHVGRSPDETGGVGGADSFEQRSIDNSQLLYVWDSSFFWAWEWIELQDGDDLCERVCRNGSYSFPVAFTGTPQIVTGSSVGASVATSLSATAVTITRATSTGFLELNGY
jgi:hypothetical protein